MLNSTTVNYIELHGDGVKTGKKRFEKIVPSLTHPVWGLAVPWGVENLLEGSQNFTVHVLVKIIIIDCCAVMAVTACGITAVSCGPSDQEVFI